MIKLGVYCGLAGRELAQPWAALFVSRGRHFFTGVMGEGDMLLLR